MEKQDARAATAWRSAVVASSLNVIGMAIETAIIRSAPGASVTPALLSIGVGAGLLVALLARAPSRALGNAAFILNAVAIVCALWVIDRGFEGSGRSWTPFQEHKLGMLTVAMLAAEVWIGVIGIAIYALASFVQLATFPEAIRHQLALGEPWATVAVGTFATILLAYRVKRGALERDVAVAQAQLQAAQALSRVLLTVRDLANTPLQTIALSVEIARARHPDLGPTCDRVDRSLARLRALGNRLRDVEPVAKA
jgi:hypothetical protein